MDGYDIETRELTKKFGDLIAVNKVTLKIGKRQIFGLLGPNGAGKTTFIRMLCGVLRPTSGEGWVGGFSINSEPEKVKSIIGYMSQEFGLYEDLTVEENLDFYCGIYIPDRKEARRRKEAVIEKLNLSGRLNQLAGELSGGWRQRLALSCAIVHDPSILFLDEPTSGIDPIFRREIWDIIYSLAGEGTTIFVTTHYMEEAERCSRIGFIYAGKLVANDTPENIKTGLKGLAFFNLKCSDLNRGCETLRRSGLAEDVSIYGDELHVVVREGEPIGEIVSFLESSGVEVYGSSKVTPSIEDVFVALTKEV